ncbi:MAG: hypothetical protein Q9219_000062 [cf. Caloplaca sp. 3 TL-2023]
MSGEDFPPPYNSGPSKSVMVVEKVDAAQTEIEETQAGESLDGDYVQICPHERLYFSRFRDVTRLPNLSETPNGISALTNHLVPVHFAEYPEGCDEMLIFPNGSFFGRGYVRFKFPGSDDDDLRRIIPRRHQGLLLSSHWMFGLKTSLEGPESVEELNEFMNTCSIQLCSHKLLVDFATPTWVRDVLKAIQEHKGDPVEAYQLEHLLNSKEDCRHCATLFELDVSIYGKYFEVKSKRILGNAKSPNDPIWLDQ